jgi:putative transposase
MKKLLNESLTTYCARTFKKKLKHYNTNILNNYNKHLLITDENLTTILNFITLQKKYKLFVKKINLIDNPLNNCIQPSFFCMIQNDYKIEPFWSNKIQILSDKLFLPIKENLVKINPIDISIDGLSIKEYKSNKKNYELKIKKETIEPKLITKTKKIKLFFTKEQKETMKVIFGTYRYYYNRTITYINNIDTKNKTSWFLVDSLNETTKTEINLEGGFFNFIDMRKKLKNPKPNWIIEGFPSHLIDLAIRECLTNFTTCLEMYKKIKKPFKLKFKTKKNIEQSINLEAYMIGKNGIFVNWQINNTPLFKNIKSSEQFMKEHYGSTLTYNKILNTYYLNLTYKINSNPVKHKKLGAIDPGVRTPATVYSTNNVVEIGNDMQERIFKVCHEIDIIKSNMNKKEYYKNVEQEIIIIKMTPDKKAQLRRALHRKIQYLKNIKKEFHNKLINYLCDNFSTIIFPPFKTQEMVGKLHSKTSRQMYNLSFYQLREKLRNKCKELHVILLEHSEAYTSKTCTKCGNVKYKLGSNKIYNCKKCNLTIDRDINGSRNILLKNIFFA